MVLLLQCSSSVHTLVLFLFYILLLTSSMEVPFSDAGRLPLRLLPDTDGTNKVMAANKQEAAARIKCECVCMSCGHCEAVQVPIVPQEQKEKARAAAAVTLAAAMFTYRVDGITNYKPLSWKCRYGGTIQDP